MDLRELQEWFGANELAPCPRCRETAALALERAQALLCFRCGYIRAHDLETSVRELQSPLVRAD
jgi:hypothetical protein